MKYVRWFLVALVLCYTAWIAFPVVKAFVFPPSSEPTIASRTMDQDSHYGGFGNSTYAEDMAPAPMPMESIQGDTAVQAIETQNTPVVMLWAGVILLYLVAAFLHANGNVRAAITYLLGFLADVVLTYITTGQAGGQIYEKVFTILAGWDPRYVLTLVALFLGFLIWVSRGRPLPRLRTALPL